MIFKTCPYCGANLDPEEICDCLKSQIEHSREIFDNYIAEHAEISPVGMAATVAQAMKNPEES